MANLCVCCESSSPVFFGRSTDTPIRPGIELQRCPNCRLVSQAIRLESFPETWYDYYRSLLGLPIDQVYNPINSEQIRRFLHRISAFLTPSRQPALLDVGCGIGGIVQVACSMGWQARGIDLSVSAVEVGKSFGVPLEVIDFFDARILPQSVDIITMSEFIEHVPMPNQILRRAEEVLRPGGVLYLTTPNFDCLDHRLTGPLWRAIGGEHLFYFTPATLKEVVRRHTTFEIVNLATKNLSPLILISWLKRLAGWKSAADATLEDGLVVGAGAELEQDLRRWGSGSLAFALAKRAANSALNAFGLGRTIEVTLRRPASADNTSR